MTFEYNGLVWFQTIGLKETAVSDQSRFQANGGAVYNTPGRVQRVELKGCVNTRPHGMRDTIRAHKRAFLSSVI